MCKKDKKSLLRVNVAPHCVIKCSVIIVLIALAALFLVKSIVSLCCYIKTPVEENYQYFCDIAQTAAMIFEGLAVTATFVMAIVTWKTSKKVGNIEALGKIREMLRDPNNREIHEYLEKGDWNNPSFENMWEKRKCDFYNYLGTLELLNVYLSENIIKYESFYNQFGYRIENVYNCAPLMNKITNEDAQYWEELNKLINTVKTKKEEKQ